MGGVNLRNSLSAFMIWAGVVGCSDRASVESGASAAFLPHDGLEVQHLSSETFFSGDVLGLPFRVAVVGDYLVVLEAFADPAFHVFRLEDGQLLGSFGGFGGGPGEFRSPRSLDPVPGSCCELWVYDLGTARLTHVDLDSLLADETALGDSSVTLLTERVPIEARWLDREQIVSTGFFDKGRLAVFDLRGSPVRWIGEFPSDGREAPAAIVQHAYQSTLTVHPDHVAVAVGTRHAGLLEIFDLTGGAHLVAKTPFSFEPRYDIEQGRGGPRMALVPETRLGYVDVTSTDTRIYALFSGRTIAGYGSNAAFGRFVHVFDWSGHFIRALELDAAIVGLAVDPRTQALYGLSHDPEPAIVVFPL